MSRFPIVEPSLMKKIQKVEDGDVRLQIKTYSRNSTITIHMVGKTVHVYNGKKFEKILINQEMVGYKLGEFSFTRKCGKIHNTKKNS